MTGMVVHTKQPRDMSVQGLATEAKLSSKAR